MTEAELKEIEEVVARQGVSRWLDVRVASLIAEVRRLQNCLGLANFRWIEAESELAAVKKLGEQLDAAVAERARYVEAYDQANLQLIEAAADHQVALTKAQEDVSYWRDAWATAQVKLDCMSPPLGRFEWQATDVEREALARRAASVEAEMSRRRQVQDLANLKVEATVEVKGHADRGVRVFYGDPDDAA